MNIHFSVPLIPLIPWNMFPISFSIAIVHFVFLGPFIRCLYSWDLPVSRQMTAFLFSGWIVKYPVFLFVCAQSSPILCTVHTRNDVGAFLGGRIVATWLAMRLLTFSRMDLVLYMCTSGTLHMLPSYE